MEARRGAQASIQARADPVSELGPVDEAVGGEGGRLERPTVWPAEWQEIGRAHLTWPVSRGEGARLFTACLLTALTTLLLTKAGFHIPPPPPPPEAFCSLPVDRADDPPPVKNRYSYHPPTSACAAFLSKWPERLSCLKTTSHVEVLRECQITLTSPE